MGIWGPKLYEDDLALDIKQDYIEKIDNGVTNEKALSELKKMYKETIEDSDEGPIFWMILADTMWELGNLTEEVKNKAIEEIEKGNNLKIWKEEASEEDYKKREKELEKLKEKLNSPMHIKEKKTLEKKKNDWDIGDVYAYKLKSDKARELGLDGNYLLLRKVEESEVKENKISAIIYCQITKELPKTEEELENLEYIIFFNIGNVKYEYRIDLYDVTQKTIKDELLYIGNFRSIKEPINKYNSTINLCSYKNLENKILRKIEVNGTSKNPKRKEVDPKTEVDDKIRFLMLEKYYKETLEITPKKELEVKEEPISYISLIDSMIIKGVKEVTLEMKEKAYKKIKELKDIVVNQNENKEVKIKVLEDLEQKIREYEDKDLLAEFMKKTQE